MQFVNFMMRVKFVDLGRQYSRFREQILAVVDSVGSSGNYVLGPSVEEFENAFSEYCGVSYALGIGNGSDALFLSLRALEIGPGDEVITAPNSFVASAASIARTGAKVALSDVGDDMNLDPKELDKAIGRTTKAIMPVHLTGKVANMEAILAISESYGLFVVEDAAQAIGAARNGTKAGAFGDLAGFSLHPLKNLHVMGDGGVITTDDAGLYESLKKLRNHGLSTRDECELWGINSRLDSLDAAIAMIKLKEIETTNGRFREIANIYTTELCSYVECPQLDEGEVQVFHRYMIRHPQRNMLQSYLADEGIETKVNYPIPIHLQNAAYELGYKEGAFPKAEELCRTTLSLPIYAEMHMSEVEYVVDKVKEFSSLPSTYSE